MHQRWNAAILSAALLAGLAPASARAQSDAAPSPPDLDRGRAITEAITALEVRDVSADLDLLSFDRDTLLQGEISGRLLEIEGAFGKASVPLDEVALIRGGAGGRSVRVFLRNGEVLAGHVRAEALRFRSGEGVEFHLVPEGIRALIRPDPGRDFPVPQGAIGFVQTRAGDRLALSAAAREVPLELVTPWGCVRVPLGRIVWQQTSIAGGARWRLKIDDGSRLSGVPRTASVSLPTVRWGTVTFPALELERIEPGREIERAAPTLEPDTNGRSLVAILSTTVEDAIAAGLGPEPLELLGSFGAISLDPGQIVQVRRQEGEGAEDLFEVGLDSGATWKGRLLNPWLSARWGDFTLRVPRVHLRLFVRWRKVGETGKEDDE